MARPRKSTEKLERYSFGLAPSMRKEMRHAGGKMDAEDAEALRLAAAIGFKFLRVIDYDVAGSIIQRALSIADKKKKTGG